MYQSPDESVWKGRNDPGQTELDYLWHHVIRLVDLQNDVPHTKEKAVAFLGFVSDEGVKRNKGRVGASEGPEALRKAMCNLAVHFDHNRHQIFDAGNVITSQGKLEEAQQELANKVKQLLDHGYFPILLGGGHEIAYGHFCGVRDYLKDDDSTGIINFDSHFDLRKYDSGPHSGSPFLQIMDDCKARGELFRYLPVGINQAANNRRLFQVMEEADQFFITSEEITESDITMVERDVNAFMGKVDHLYVTLDLDVISAAFAPGVSAPAPFGVSPQLISQLMKCVLESGKVRSLDIAELNPTYDDGRTAKVAAQFVYQIVMSFFN